MYSTGETSQGKTKMWSVPSSAIWGSSWGLALGAGQGKRRKTLRRGHAYTGIIYEADMEMMRLDWGKDKDEKD